MFFCSSLQGAAQSLFARSHTDRCLSLSMQFHFTVILRHCCYYLYIHGDEIRCMYRKSFELTSQQISLFTSHDDGQLQLQIKVSSLSAFRTSWSIALRPTRVTAEIILCFIIILHAQKVSERTNLDTVFA